MRKIMSMISLMGLSAVLSACGGGGGGSGSGLSILPDLSPPASESLSLPIEGGNGFECFALRKTVYCRGSSIDHNVGVSSVNFSEYAHDADSDIVALNTWDDTICLDANVNSRPYSHTLGLGIYCFGEATLQNAPGGQPVVYGGPNYSTATNGSSDLTYSVEPMMGGDLSYSQFIAGNMITDGTSHVTSRSENCTRVATTLTCQTFAATVRDE